MIPPNPVLATRDRSLTPVAMTRLRVCALAGVLAATTACSDAGPDLGGADHRVLFLGNSLTYSNDLPGMLETMGEAEGLVIVTCDMSLPNYAIEDHWNTPASREALADGPWSVVVLQQGPSSLPENRENLVEWTGVWADEIRRVGAAPALYMVWPDRSRLAYFDDVSLSYRTAAAEAAAGLYPAGEAWRAAWDADALLPLYSGDEFHPSVMGTYLAALTIYRGLTNRNPPSLASELGFSARDDGILHEAARVADEEFGRQAVRGSGTPTTAEQDSGGADTDSPRRFPDSRTCDPTSSEGPA